MRVSIGQILPHLFYPANQSGMVDILHPLDTTEPDAIDIHLEALTPDLLAVA